VEEQIRRRIQIAIKEKLFPGCVVGVIRTNGEGMVLAYGRHTYTKSSKPMRVDSVFDVASITKAIPLAAVTLSLAEQGTLDLDEPIATYLPDFDTSPDKRLVTLRHLLTNSVDLAILPLSWLKNEPPQSIIKTVCEAPLKALPGTVYKYTNTSALLLSLYLMKVSPISLGVLAKRLYFDPLGMHDSSFSPHKDGRIVPTEIDPWRARKIEGEVHDESTYVLQQLYGENCIGTAGLFSTVPDLLRFVEMLLRDGKLYGIQYFKEETVRAMHTDHFPKAGGAGGLGWTLYPQDFMGKHGTPTMFGKTGFTGCMIMIDRSKERGLVILSNYHYPRRKTDLLPNKKFRADMCDIVFG